MSDPLGVARAGQDGYHHRTSVNHKVYRIGKEGADDNGTTALDVTKKTITPYVSIVFPLVRNHANIIFQSRWLRPLR